MTSQNFKVNHRKYIENKETTMKDKKSKHVLDKY